MPTILLLHGFRFFFYSNEGNEPAHIHVIKGNGEGKIWLEPVVETAWMTGFTQREENMINEIIADHAQFFISKWNEFFSK